VNGKEFSDVIKSRRSIRRFADREISRELLSELMEAAAAAPSAGNRHDCEFDVVVSPEIKRQMRDATQTAWDKALAGCETEAVRDELGQYRGNFEWFSVAPVIVVVSCKRTPLFMEPMFEKSAGNVAGHAASALMAAENLLLAAHACGLGGCCLTGPLAAAAAFKQLLNLERRREIVCLIALGYPAETVEPSLNRPKPTMRIV